MAHGLIIGPTLCGKTTLAKRLIKEAKSRGVPSLVLDPLGNSWEDAAFVTADTEQYIEVVFSNHNFLLVIDEAIEALGNTRARATMHHAKLATRSRHQGHRAVFIGQKYTKIDATIRAQCSKLWLFRQHRRELDSVAYDFARDGWQSEAETLRRGECLYITTFGDTIDRINVFA